MKFSLDTKDYGNIKLFLSDDECEKDLFELLEEFCYATASFFAVFALKRKYGTEQAEKLKKAFLRCTERDIDIILEEGVLDIQRSENEDVDNPIEELKTELKKSGISDDDIENVIKLLGNPDGEEEAIEYLQKLMTE